MAIKPEKIVVGMTLYDRHSERMGNTTMRSIGEWPVKVISIDQEKGLAMVSWNGNRPHQQSLQNLSKHSSWSMRDPDVIVVRGMWGAVRKVRKMTKAEVARVKACTCDMLTAPKDWQKYEVEGHHADCPSKPNCAKGGCTNKQTSPADPLCVECHEQDK